MKRLLWFVDYDDTLLASSWAIEIMSKTKDLLEQPHLHEFANFRIRHDAELNVLQVRRWGCTHQICLA